MTLEERAWKTLGSLAVIVISLALAGGCARTESQKQADDSGAAADTTAAAADTTAKAATKTGDAILDEVEDEGYAAYQAIRFARVSIFDGYPEEASTYLSSARTTLEQIQKRAPDTVVTVKTEQRLDGKTVSSDESTVTTDLIPVDAWLELSEDFIATPERESKITRADEHLKAGHHDQALDTLREAEIDVFVTRLMMPLKATIAGVDRASALLEKHSYYEANLALKEVEEGLVTDTSVMTVPEGADTDEGAAEAPGTE
jgi:hypothetical protein